MSNLEQVPASNLTYRDQRSFGVVGGKSQVEIAPKYGGDPFKAGDVIRLEIPSQAFLDPAEFFIQMRCRILPGINNNVKVGTVELPATSRAMPYIRLSDTFNQHVINPEATKKKDYRHVRFVPGIQSVFERVKLLSGSTTIEDIQDYNILHRMILLTTTTPEWRSADGMTSEGFYNPKDPVQTHQAINAHTAKHGGKNNDGHYYSFRPLLGLFNAGKLLPLKYMGQLTLELYLAPNQECLWSSTSLKHYTSEGSKFKCAHTNLQHPELEAAPTQHNHYSLLNDGAANTHADFPNAYYEIDRVRMQLPFVHPIEEFDKELMHTIETEGLDIHFSSFSAHTRQISSIGRTVLSFQERALFLKGGLVCMRNSPAIRNIQTDIQFPANGMRSYQWKIGSEYVPAQEIVCDEGGTMALNQLMKSVGTFGNSEQSHNILQEDFLPMDLPGESETQNRYELQRETSQPSKFMMGLNLDKSNGQISGFDSAAAGVDVELIINTRSQVETNDRFDATWTQQGNKHCQFQPTKIKVTSGGHVYAGGNSELGYHGVLNNGLLVRDSTVATPTTRYVPGLRGGHMFNTDLVETYTFTGQDVINISASLAPAAANMYSRVHFFAHIDQVLRLRRVGQIEVVR